MKKSSIKSNEQLFNRLNKLDQICLQYFKSEKDAFLAYNERDKIVAELQNRLKNDPTHSIHNL